MDRHRQTERMLPGAATGPAGALLAGRFRLIRLLGEGTMGRVYEAEDRLVGDRVAVKRLRRDWLPDPEVVARCRREVEAARRIAHPNVCRVFDLVVEEDAGGEREVLLTMEHVRGETLAARLEHRGRLSPDEVLPIVRQLCAALGAAHAAGVVHRDLKPANVLLEPGPDGDRVVVTDFGLARCLAGSAATLTTHGDLMGSPAYVAPEQVRGEPATPAADLFALGVVLYELVTGRLPFEGESAVTTALARLHGPPPPPSRLAPDVDRRWDRVILRCLALDPADRYPEAGAVVAALSGRGAARPAIPARRLARVALLGVLLLVGGWTTAHRVRHAPGPGSPSPAPAPAGPGHGASRESGATFDVQLDEAAGRLRADEVDDAEALYEQILVAARARGDKERVVRALTGLGIVRSRHNDLVQAERLDREALRIARELGDTTRIASLLNNLGVVAVRQGHLPEAEKLYREAASLYDAAGDPRRRAAALNNLGVMLRHQGHLVEAEQAHRQSLVLRRSVGDLRGEAVTLLGLGRLGACRGQAGEAQGHFTAALRIFRSEGHPDGAAETLVALGETALSTGDAPAAGRALDEAVDLSRQHGYRRWEADAARVRALASLGHGEPAEAVRRARASLISFEEQFDAEGRARAGVVLARALVAAGAAAEARTLLARLRTWDWVRQDRALRLSAALADAVADGALGAEPDSVRERLGDTAREASRYGLGSVERNARLELAAFEPPGARPETAPDPPPADRVATLGVNP